MKSFYSLIIQAQITQFSEDQTRDKNILNHYKKINDNQQEQLLHQAKKNQFQVLINAAEYSLEFDTDYSPIVDGKKINLNVYKNTSKVQDSIESLQAKLK